MIVTREKVHDYLGMDLDYTKKGVLRVSMIKYLKKVFDNFLEQITSTSSSPAVDHLFKICEGDAVKVLPKEQAVNFHHTVAQLLFVSTRARPNISTAISFLSTRVKQPDEDD